MGARVDQFDPVVTLEGVRAAVERFVADRDWEKFHTPRNVALALVGEVGEVCELIQWKGELGVGAPELSADERVKLGEELSDVLVYLMRLGGEFCVV
jgi:dCTP diphosphatase